MYAAIRQGKAKAGMAEELARSIFDDYAGAEESNRRGLAWSEQSLAPLLTGPATAVAGPVIVYTLA
jgi:hypothetical protein